MRSKVDTLIDSLKATISGWSSVECMTIDPRSEIFDFDPYFALVIDVYYRGQIPGPDARQRSFGNPGAFETAASLTKDRFFLEEVPIRIEYKNLKFIDALVDNPLENLSLLKNSGTYPFYRILQHHVIFDKSGWIAVTRQKLEHFPDRAWLALFDNFCSKMEHYLSDLGGACISEDSYFLLISQSGFMRYAAASVFMANERFEPSHREISVQLTQLPRMPEGFLACWRLLLRKELELEGPKRFDLARAMARSVLEMQPDLYFEKS
jgi:hypothetical protein